MLSSTRTQAGALVLSRALGSGSFYAWMPFMPIWLVRDIGVEPLFATNATATLVLLTRAGGLIVFPLISALGLRRSAFLGQLFVGLVLLGGALTPESSEPLYLVGAALAGLGYSTATLALRSMVALDGSAAEARFINFSALNLAVNGGSGLGPVLGGLVLESPSSATLLPLLGAGLSGAAALATAWCPNPSATGSPEPAEPHRRRYRDALTLLVFAALTKFAYAHVFNVLALYLVDVLTPSTVGLLFGLNAALIVAMQLPVSSWVARSNLLSGRSRGRLLLVANLGVALGVVLFVPVHNMASLSLAIAAMSIFTLAECVWSPAYDTMVAEVVPPGRRVLGYAITGVAWGGVESAGTAVGLGLTTGGAGGTAFALGASAAALAGVGFLVGVGRQHVSAGVSQSPQEG